MTRPATAPTSNRVRRRYTDEDVANARALYEACEHNANEVARITGIPLPTIQGWIPQTCPSRNLYNHPPVEVQRDAKERLAAWMEKTANRGIRQAFKRLPDCNAPQAALVTGIAVDKMLLLRDQVPAGPSLTVNIGAGIQPEQLRAAIRALSPPEEEIDGEA